MHVATIYIIYQLQFTDMWHPSLSNIDMCHCITAVYCPLQLFMRLGGWQWLHANVSWIIGIDMFTEPLSDMTVMSDIPLALYYANAMWQKCQLLKIDMFVGRWGTGPDMACGGHSLLLANENWGKKTLSIAVNKVQETFPSPLRSPVELLVSPQHFGQRCSPTPTKVSGKHWKLHREHSGFRKVSSTLPYEINQIW